MCHFLLVPCHAVLYQIRHYSLLKRFQLEIEMTSAAAVLIVLRKPRLRKLPWTRRRNRQWALFRRLRYASRHKSRGATICGLT